jgi:ribose/xylose/arabinose/galactoside ABC-type transport system permease subunit
MLAAAPGGVIGALLTTSLQTPASVLDFATLQSAVSTGMMVGFVTGVGLSLMIRGIQGWRAGSTITALGLAIPIFTLATMATSRMCACSTKEKAYIAAMKSDLRNLATEQEIYFAEHGSYMPDIRAVTDYAISYGVKVEIVAALPTGWYATAAHEGTPVTCAIYFGDGVPTTRASPGELDCE